MRLNLLGKSADLSPNGELSPAGDFPQQEEQPKENKHRGLLYGGVAATGLGLGLANAGSRMLSSQDEGNLNQFLAHSQGWAKGEDPRQMMNEYVTNASSAAGGSLFGQRPVDFMKNLRSGPWMSAIPTSSGIGPVDRMGNQMRSMKWNPNGSDYAHYQAFGQGPLSGYMQLTNEFTGDSSQQWRFNDMQRHLLPGIGKIYNHNNSLLKGFIPDITQNKQPNGMDFGLQANPEVLKSYHSLMKDTGGADINPFKGNRPPINPSEFQGNLSHVMDNFLKDHGVKVPLDQLDRGTQEKLFPQFDAFAKQKAPELWRQKQYVDWMNAGTRVPAAGYFYGNAIMKPIMALKHFGTGAGLATGAAGLGLLGTYFYKRMKEKKEREQQALQGQQAQQQQVQQLQQQIPQQAPPAETLPANAVA